MVRINVVYEDKMIKKITLKGHADYREYGSDIVCAAVSATYLCTVNGVLSINEDAINVVSDNDKQIINVIDEDINVNKLLINMIECFKSLEKQYPNNIKIK